ADADGLLPPWTEWWPSEDTAVLLPDGTVRAAVEREQRRLPLAYFEAAVPSPPGWRDLPAAYLAFGEAYAEETARARASGWRVEVLPGEHLHLVVDPEAVADFVVDAPAG
ncbi:MAG: hypothetical protein HOQ45_12540, partial [Nocardioidaceae bacterium]|nr:hypothetical protein [Nocardioidaceae bacterium]